MSTTLTARQRHFVQALVSHGGDIPRASAEVGINRATGYRWMDLGEVTKALADVDREAIRAASRRLARLGAKAVQELEKIIDDPKISAATRLRALDAALNHMLRVAELVDHGERLTALQEALSQQEEHRGSAH